MLRVLFFSFCPCMRRACFDACCGSCTVGQVGPTAQTQPYYKLFQDFFYYLFIFLKIYFAACLTFTTCPYGVSTYGL